LGKELPEVFARHCFDARWTPCRAMQTRFLAAKLDFLGDRASFCAAQHSFDRITGRHGDSLWRDRMDRQDETKGEVEGGGGKANDRQIIRAWIARPLA
jgi:hypothetical protein